MIGTGWRMHLLIKLNMISALCGFIFFVAVSLGVNMYRIQRITGVSFESLEKVYAAFYIMGFILSTDILILLTKKWMKGKPSRFWTLLLWFPYFLSFNHIFTYLFPLTDRGDIPSPGAGLIIIFGIIIYPFYLTVINLCAMEEQ